MTLVTTPLAPPYLRGARRVAAVALPGGAVVSARTDERATRLAAVHLFAGISVLLVGGIAVSILTAPDHQWLFLYFSQLGTVTLFSGFAFNGTLMLAGLMIFLLASRVRQEVRAHSARVASPRRAPIVVSALVASMGLHLSMVGMIPINTIKPLHDWAALGITISFAVLLIVSPIFVRGLGRTFLAMNLPAGVLLVGGFSLLTLGMINLTAFELLGFGSMFTWLSLFFGCLVPRSMRMSHADLRDIVRARRRHVRRALPLLALRITEGYASPRHSSSFSVAASSVAVAESSAFSPAAVSSSTCTGVASTLTSSTGVDAVVSASLCSVVASAVAESSVSTTGVDARIVSISSSTVDAGCSAVSTVSALGASATTVAMPAVAAASRALRSLRVSNAAPAVALAA
jgi:hypothetical membrane protein